jgi:glutamate racemase
LQQQDLPIGVFDSGIGGLSVASAIHHELSQERIFYFGDTARCPYGDRDPEEVVQFSVQICDFLYDLGVKVLVVACNTATAAALPILTRRYDVPVIGVIQPGARAAARATTGDRIGVIGTAVTVRSGAYESAIKEKSPNARVYSLACPTFVPLVEQGLWKGKETEQAVRAGLLPLLATDIDTLILGCTHYPHLQETIQQVMGENVRLISSAYETAADVRRILTLSNLLTTRPERVPDVFYTTGDGAKMRVALTRWMDIQGDLADLREVRWAPSLARSSSAQ